jgi:hypothetical protein
MNQTLAGLARTLDLATLDLEAASDSISRKVVQLLLPPVWFELLDELRSPWYQKVDGSWVRLEKFSSMGNGFTFELESLIFWALASAASETLYRSTIGIYGDDVIVHRDVVPLLVEVFRTLGFRLNTDKSFVTGDFFESCGKHYFKDIDVTPAYQKCSPVDGVEACKLGNRLLRLASRLGHHVLFDKRVRGAWEYWTRRWDVDPSAYGPFIGEGDGYWEAPASLISHRTRYGSFGPWYRVACYSNVKRVIPANDEAMYALWLMQSGASHEVPFGGSSACAIKRLADIRDPDVSITGSYRKPIITSSSAEIGMIDSRVENPKTIRHRHVHCNGGHSSTYLDW